MDRSHCAFKLPNDSSCCNTHSGRDCTSSHHSPRGCLLEAVQPQKSAAIQDEGLACDPPAATTPVNSTTACHTQVQSGATVQPRAPHPDCSLSARNITIEETSSTVPTLQPHKERAEAEAPTGTWGATCKPGWTCTGATWQPHVWCCMPCLPNR